MSLAKPYSAIKASWAGLVRKCVVLTSGVDPDQVGDTTTYSKLVASLFSSPSSLLQAMIASNIPAAFCWIATGDEVFKAVMAAVIAANLFRFKTYYSYRKTDHTNDSYATTRSWDSEFVLGATLVSGLLGLNGYLAIANTSSGAAHMTAMCFNIALGSAYVARNAARPYFVILQLILFTAPPSLAALRLEDRLYNWTAYFVILYVVNNVAVVFSVYRNLVDLVQSKKTADWLAAQLQTQNENLDIALNTMPHGAASFDRKLNLLVANARHFTLFGLDDSARGMTFAGALRQLLHAGFASRATLGALVTACQASLKKRETTQVEVATSSDSNLIVHFNPSAEGGVLMFTEDATARRRAEAEVQRLARFDTLTDLPNRYTFGAALEQAYRDLEKSGSAFSLLYVDLDDFKRINDTLGHPTGDALLVEVGRRLLQCDKGLEARVYRLGGDEFAALVAGGLDAALALACAIKGSFQDPFLVRGCSLKIGASIGLAFAPEHGADAEELLGHADLALYRSKASGRGAVTVFNDEIAAQFAERVELESELAAMIASDALEMHYQPIVDLQTNEVVSYEALMRWPHPSKGYISPAVFIPIAEQTGQIEGVGCFAIRRACADAVMWNQEISVSVNVSVLQFRNPELLIATIEEALAANRLDPGRLTLEITESLLIEEFEQTLAIIEKIRALGVKFSLDDFGTGYSSLSNLGRLPLSVVKIDRSLTNAISSDPRTYAVVEAICALSKRLALAVVIEGVETAEQRIAVQLVGADRIQGWLTGRPIPATHIPSRARPAA